MMRTTQDTGNDAQVMLGSSFGRPHQLGRLREVLAFLSFVAPWERAAGTEVWAAKPLSAPNCRSKLAKFVLSQSVVEASLALARESHVVQSFSELLLFQDDVVVGGHMAPGSAHGEPCSSPKYLTSCVAKFSVRFLKRSVLLVTTDQPIVNVDVRDANQFVAVAHHVRANWLPDMSNNFAVPIAAHRHGRTLFFRMSGNTR